MKEKINLHLIAAISSNFVIGKDNDLVLTHKEDFKFFKELTMGHCVIMGRKTYQSLPKGPLPGRRNVVISKNLDWIKEDEVEYQTPHLAILKNDVVVIIDLELYLYNLSQTNGSQHKFFVIGGGEIYKIFLQSGLVKELYITYWDKEIEGDTVFPSEYFEQYPVVEVKDAETTNEFKFFKFSKQ